METMTPETTPTIPASRIGPSSLARTSARHFQGASKGRLRRAIRRDRSIGTVTILSQQDHWLANKPEVVFAENCRINSQYHCGNWHPGSALTLIKPSAPVNHVDFVNSHFVISERTLSAVSQASTRSPHRA